jgi:predicted TIM-barrel fold metal-dependent hydrolase
MVMSSTLGGVMVIDMYCHILPVKVVASYLKKRLPFLISFIQPLVSGDDLRFVDPEYRIRYMDRFGIDMEVLTLPYNSLWETLGEDEAMEIAKTVNDALASISQKYPSRFAAAATLPYLTGAALDELDRCISDLGLKGVLIFSNMNGKPLNSSEFEPFYRRMAKYDLPIWIHPAHWPYYPWFGYKYDLTHVFGYPFETAVAAAMIVYAGILERYQNLKFVLHHLGGIIPAVAGRIKEFYEMAAHSPHIFGQQYSGLTLRREPLQYFKAMYVDTVVCGMAHLLEWGYQFYGPEHLLFGTDYPFGPEGGEKWTRENLHVIRDLPITPEEKHRILEENAKQILRIT